jgi:hypothetical protein
LIVLAGSALIAVGQARYTRARREVNQALARDLSRHSPTDTVVVASAWLTPQPWQNPAATLGRYAVAIRAAESTAVLRDVSCDSASALQGKRGRGTTLYVYVDGCGEMGVPDRRIQRQYSFFDWGSGGMKSAVVTVDVFHGRILERSSREAEGSTTAWGLPLLPPMAVGKDAPEVGRRRPFHENIGVRSSLSLHKRN